MEENRELVDNGGWTNSSGLKIQLCVVEELDITGNFSVPAYTTFGGFALCRPHFRQVTGMIREGIPMGQVVNQMMTEGL